MIHRKHTIGCLITTLLVVFFLNSMCYSGWPTDFTDRSIGNIIIVDIIWVISYFVPIFFVKKDSDDGHDGAFFIAYLGALACCCIITCWITKTYYSDIAKFKWWEYVLLIPFSALFNIIPLGFISGILLCANPSKLGGSSSSSGGSSESNEHKSLDNSTSKPDFTGHMSFENSGVKLDFYKTNDKEFNLVHEKFFGREVLHFRLDKSNDMFKHDYIVTTDSGKVYYADINKVRFPHEPNITLYAEGKTIPLTYEDLWEV